MSSVRIRKREKHKSYNFEKLRSADLLSRGGSQEESDEEEPSSIDSHRPKSARTTKRLHHVIDKQLDTIQHGENVQELFAAPETPPRAGEHASHAQHDDQPPSPHTGNYETDCGDDHSDAEGEGHKSSLEGAPRSARSDSSSASSSAARRREREERRERRRSKQLADQKADVLAQIQSTARDKLIEQQPQQQQEEKTPVKKRERRRSRKLSAHAAELSDMVEQAAADELSHSTSTPVALFAARSASPSKAARGASPTATTSSVRRPPSKPLPSVPGGHSAASTASADGSAGAGSADGGAVGASSHSYRRERAASVSQVAELCDTLDGTASNRSAVLQRHSVNYSENASNSSSLIVGTDSLESVSSSHSQVSPVPSPRGGHTIAVGPALGAAAATPPQELPPDSPKSAPDRKLRSSKSRAKLIGHDIASRISLLRQHGVDNIDGSSGSPKQKGHTSKRFKKPRSHSNQRAAPTSASRSSVSEDVPYVTDQDRQEFRRIVRDSIGQYGDGGARAVKKRLRKARGSFARYMREEFDMSVADSGCIPVIHEYIREETLSYGVVCQLVSRVLQQETTTSVGQLGEILLSLRGKLTDDVLRETFDCRVANSGRSTLLVQYANVCDDLFTATFFSTAVTRFSMRSPTSGALLQVLLHTRNSLKSPRLRTVFDCSVAKSAYWKFTVTYSEAVRNMPGELAFSWPDFRQELIARVTATSEDEGLEIIREFNWIEAASHTAESNTLFRTDSWATQLTTDYGSAIASDYLQGLVRHFLRAFPHNKKEAQLFWINPTHWEKMHWKYRDDLDKQARNAYNFVKAASDCLDTFLREPVPFELQRLLSMRRQLVEKKYPEKKDSMIGVTFASEVLVLRLLGQVITPEIENSSGGAFDPVKSTLWSFWALVQKMAAGSPFIQLEDSVSDPSASDSEKVNKQLNNQRNQYLLTLQRAYSRYHDSLVAFVDENSQSHLYTPIAERALGAPSTSSSSTTDSSSKNNRTASGSRLF